MEQNSTKESNRGNVPGQNDFLSEFDFSFPEIEPISKIDLFPLDSFFRDLQKETQKTMAQFMSDSEKMMQDADKWVRESQAAIENNRQNMTFKKYVDSEGYQVMEGKSKDGYVIIQRRKKVGNQFEYEMEIFKEGKLEYKSSSLQNFFSYRGKDGQMVTVEKNDDKRNESHTSYSTIKGENVYKTSYATIKKRPRRRKSTNTWMWLLIIGIAAVAIYVMFLR